jgi:hypothetical protein
MKRKPAPVTQWDKNSFLLLLSCFVLIVTFLLNFLYVF